MDLLPAEPLFWFCAVPAVLIVAVAKGGLGGGIGIIGVPLMALAISPVRAAAIMLPLLMLMDAFALRSYWRRWDSLNLRIILPGAVLGTALGWLAFERMSADQLRVLVGLIALGYAGWWWAGQWRPGLIGAAKAPGRTRGTLWSSLAGFTSFSVHAGGPPINVYLLGQQLDRTTFQATTVVFFFVVNWLKLPPYVLLGQFDASNLGTSLALAPLAPLGIAIGAWAHQRVDDRVFFRFIYAGLVLVGGKLLWDGL